MYNVPWQDGRIYQTPVGALSASFLLRPNTMFHPEGEWSVRLLLMPFYAYRLRQMIAPAQADIVTRARAMYENLPVEQQVNRPFKENPYWQPAVGEGGLESENVLFTFRLPTILHEPAVAPQRQPEATTSDNGDATKTKGRTRTKAAATPRQPRRSKNATKVEPVDPAANLAATEPHALRDRPAIIAHNSPAAALTRPEPMLEVHTRVTLTDAQGETVTNLNLEPDGWEASISFSIHQYWLRSFGAGVTLRLHGVQLLSQQPRTIPGHRGIASGDDEPDMPLPIAL
ncbi:MAG TPA: hypothetical protein VM659_04190 [Dongiaceae bacterium]|nr:hypothetical protein [Dongiaceae bacterium]